MGFPLSFSNQNAGVVCIESYEEIIVFGCGGVGSWLANLIARNKLCKVLSLVDFDMVEGKNLARQDFITAQVGQPKAASVQANCNEYQGGGFPIVSVAAYDRRVADKLDLCGFNRDAVAIVATDNILSKRLIAGHFSNFLIPHCDKNFVEVKNFLDGGDLAAWDLGGGYSNGQDIVSNLFAANLIFFLLSRGGAFGQRRRFFSKVEDQFASGFAVVHDGQ